jgi:hypothetical protein
VSKSIVHGADDIFNESAVPALCKAVDPCAAWMQNIVQDIVCTVIFVVPITIESHIWVEGVVRNLQSSRHSGTTGALIVPSSEPTLNELEIFPPGQASVVPLNLIVLVPRQKE